MKMKNKPHVLFLVYYFPPLESAGYSIRAVKLLKYLCPEGWRFTLITGHPQYPIRESVMHSSQYLLDEVPADVKVIRIPAPIRLASQQSARITQLISPIADWLWMQSSYRVVKKIAAQDPFDLILATGPPFTTVIMGKKAKKNLGVPLIVEFRDDWADTPSVFQESRLFQIWKRRLERQTVEVADRIVMVTEASIAHSQFTYPEHRTKLHYISNGWDPEDVPPVLEKEDNPDQFIISTAGGYYRKNRSPEPFFRAVGQLVRRRPDIRSKIRLQLFGNTLYNDFSAEEMKQFGVADLVVETPSLPRTELMRRLQASGLMLAIASTRNNRSIPGKLYEYWAIGRAPILMIDNPGNAPSEFVKKYGLGTVVAQRDQIGMEKTIEAHYDAWATGAPERIPLEGLDRFNRQVLAKKMGDVMQSAITANP